MTQDTQQQTGSAPGYGLVFAALASMVFVFAAVSFLFFNKPALPGEFVSFTGLPEGAGIETILETKGGNATVLQAEGNAITLPDTIRRKIGTPYRISSSMKFPGGGYRDFTLTIGKDRHTITILADGFTSKEKITFSINGQPVQSRIPMDWSGRLELEAALPDEDSVVACIEISGMKDSIGLCHAIPERRAS